MTSTWIAIVIVLVVFTEVTVEEHSTELLAPLKPINLLQNSDGEQSLKYWSYIVPWSTVEAPDNNNNDNNNDVAKGMSFKSGTHHVYELPVYLWQTINLSEELSSSVINVLASASLMSLGNSKGTAYLLFYYKNGYVSKEVILADWVSNGEWRKYHFETCVPPEIISVTFLIGATSDGVCGDDPEQCQLDLNVYADNLVLEMEPVSGLINPCLTDNGGCSEICVGDLPLGTCQYVARCECHFPREIDPDTNRCELPTGMCFVPSDCPFYDPILWPGTCVNFTCGPPPNCVNDYEAPCIQNGDIKFCCQPGACCSIYGYCGSFAEHCYSGCHNGPCNQKAQCPQKKTQPQLGGIDGVFCCEGIPCYYSQHCCSLSGECSSSEDSCGLECAGGPCWNLTTCSRSACSDCTNGGGEYCEYNSGCKCSLYGGCPSRNRKYGNKKYCSLWPEDGIVRPTNVSTTTTLPLNYTNFISGGVDESNVDNAKQSDSKDNGALIGTAVSLSLIIALLVALLVILNRKKIMSFFRGDKMLAKST